MFDSDTALASDPAAPSHRLQASSGRAGTAAADNPSVYNRGKPRERRGLVPLENPKLMTLSEAAAWRDRCRTQGKRVVLTNGVFDLLHTGHIYYLQQARKLGGALAIALNADASVRALKGLRRPVQDEEQRAYALGALSCVDALTVFSAPRLVAEILALRPDVYCKAGDYTFEKLDPGERDALREVGAEIKFVPFLPGFSTTKLIERIKAAGEI